MMEEIRMFPRALLLPFLLLCGAVGASGCQAQVTPAYKGEPVATIRGSVAAQSAGPVQDVELDAALVWSRFNLYGQRSYQNTPLDQTLLTRTSVTAGFPATFTLQIFTPPPEEAFFSCYPSGDPRVGRLAFGAVAAVTRGTQVLTAQNPDAVRGGGNYRVAYIDHDLEPTSTCAVMFGVTTAGYHLLQRAGTEAEREAAAAFEIACILKLGCEGQKDYGKPGWEEANAARTAACVKPSEDASRYIDPPGGLDAPVTITMVEPVAWSPPPAPAPEDTAPHDPGPPLPPNPGDAGSSTGGPQGCP